MSRAKSTAPSVEKLLDDAERMLAYAARAGKPLDAEIPETIALAREALHTCTLTTALEGKLYCAQSRLAHAIKPVTAETLDPNSLEEARSAARFYFRLAIVMAALIVPASMVMFVNAKLSASGKELVEQNDKLALPIHDALEAQRNAILSIEKPGNGQTLRKTQLVKVTAATEQNSEIQSVSTHTEERPEIDSVQALTPSALAIKEKLQIFARNNRQLFAETKWLERLSLHGSENPYASPWMFKAETQRENLELTLPILVRPNQSDAEKSEQTALGPEHSVDDGLQKLAVYQDIRAMAQNAQHTSDFLWSAIAVYVLPVFYAVLGTLAYILRDLCARTRNQTYHGAQARFANGARIIVAVIVGTVIGLFDKFMDGSISASPLAIAFVAGYAVDPFFAFIDHVASAGRNATAS
jgi:hypothetical protein